MANSSNPSIRRGTSWDALLGMPAAPTDEARRKVEKADVTEALTALGGEVRYNQLRQQIMILTQCSKRTAQLAITQACQQGRIVQADGQYRLPLSRPCRFGGEP